MNRSALEKIRDRATDLAEWTGVGETVRVDDLLGLLVDAINAILATEQSDQPSLSPGEWLVGSVQFSEAAATDEAVRAVNLYQRTGGTYNLSATCRCGGRIEATGAGTIDGAPCDSCERTYTVEFPEDR